MLKLILYVFTVLFQFTKEKTQSRTYHWNIVAQKRNIFLTLCVLKEKSSNYVFSRYAAFTTNAATT
jgi:hypothetical protein